MNVSCWEFKLATRSSRLALVQAEEAARAVRRLLPAARFALLPCSTPGDRDKTTDLRESEADFFTRDLHAAVLSGSADCAAHSAKDLEDDMPSGVDWFWLPDPADPRDVLVLRPGEAPEGVRNMGIVGVSSRRREEYCRRTYPGLQPQGIRGTIDERLAQLDAGKYDMLIMAAAALQRLGLHDRISRWIPLEELTPPAGQGFLALTFRSGDPRFLRLRSLFVKPVVFAGAGCGSADVCTLAAWEELARCDVCLHDSLLDPSLLGRLPPAVQRVDVGKRCGEHTVPQAEINALLTASARRGQRVLRLKGGDPGIFGRLAEEIEALDALHLPYRVIPGVSSLSMATTGTGMLLTRRGVSHGFTVMTPRRQGGGCGAVGANARAALPMVFCMGAGVPNEIVKQLTTDGLPGTTPAAVVFDAGSADETVIRGSLADIAEKVTAARLTPPTSHLTPDSRPGVILVGSPAAGGYHPEWGAMMGRRVLLPCSDALQKEAAAAVRAFGGIPVSLPLMRMVPNRGCVSVLKMMREFDWLVVTSPSSVTVLMKLLPDAHLDARALPRILVAGPGTAEAFKRHGVVPDVTPSRDFGAEGLVEAAKQTIPTGAALLRVRSQLAGPALTEALTHAGFRVRDCVLYTNEALRPERVPVFDAVFFASASAVEAFRAIRPPESLAGKAVVAMGRPTLAALEKSGIRAVRASPDATAAAAIETLAVTMVQEEMEKLP
jgi:uroporphyrinogen III methyltransferase/synthase